eukprot:bmy_01466T0
MLRARRKDSDGRGHSCGKGPAGSGTGARLESRSLVWELRLEPQLASPGGQCVRLSFLGCPRDGTWGLRTKGSSALLRGRTASQSTVPGRKSPSRRFLTRRRGAESAVRPDARLRRERSSRGDFLSGGEAAEGAGWRGPQRRIRESAGYPGVGVSEDRAVARTPSVSLLRVVTRPRVEPPSEPSLWAGPVINPQFKRVSPSPARGAMAHVGSRKRSRSRSRSRGRGSEKKRKKSSKDAPRSCSASRSQSRKASTTSSGAEERSKHKARRRPRSSSSSSSSRSSSGSSSSSSSSSSSDGRKKRGKHKDKKRKKRKKRKKKLKKRDKDKAKVRQTEAVPGPSLDQWHRAAEQEEGGPVLTDEQKSRIQAMKPMTKEEWDARQSVIRKVVDPETGRTRLIKGDGEVLEEIVTKERHREINKQATRGDGLAFQMRAGLLP